MVDDVEGRGSGEGGGARGSVGFPDPYPAHGGDLSWAASRYGRDREDFLDFSCSLNPLGPPASALRAARRSLRKVARYPEPGAETVRGVVARFLGVGEDSVILGNGSTEIIHSLFRWRRPGSVLLVEPCFSEYRRAAEAVGARVESHVLRAEVGFRLDPERLARRVVGHDMAVLVNPSSVTGRFYRDEELEPLELAAAESGALLVVDESFLGLCDRAEGLTGAGPGRWARSVRISTSTKLFALAGLRGPGWLVGPGEVVLELGRHLPPWRIGEPAAAALVAALADRRYQDRTRILVPRWREDLATSLEDLPLRVFPSTVNLLLLRLARGEEGERLVHHLGRRGILVRWCRDFPGLGPEFVRVAVRRPRDNRRLVREMKGFFGSRRSVVI